MKEKDKVEIQNTKQGESFNTFSGKNSDIFGISVETYFQKVEGQKTTIEVIA